MNGKFVSYLRVSTQRQGKSGLGLEAQREAVAGYLNGGQWTLVQEVLEVESGKRSDRPELARALSLCRLHRATLLVAKLDSLARNVAFICALMEAGVKFVAIDLPRLTSSPFTSWQRWQSMKLRPSVLVLRSLWLLLRPEGRSWAVYAGISPKCQPKAAR